MKHVRFLMLDIADLRIERNGFGSMCCVRQIISDTKMLMLHECKSNQFDEDDMVRRKLINKQE